MEIEKLIEQLQKSADFEDYPVVASFAAIIEKKYLREATTALEQLQAENDRLKETISCYCDMCIEQDGVLWCQSCNEKCDYCIHPKEASHD